MNTTRRKLLRGLTGAAAGFAALQTTVSPRPSWAQQTPGTGAPDESFWQEVKAQFPLVPGTVMLNAGNLSPCPHSVFDAVVAATRDIDGDASAQNRQKYATMRETARARVAAFLGASPGEIAITRNASEGNGTIVQGLPLGPGDEVVIVDENHESNHVAWKVRAARDGFAVKTITFGDWRGSRAGLLELCVGAMGPATRIITFSDISNVSGLMLPVREISMAAHERGIWVHVDGAQSMASIPVNLHELGCDSYAASAHKWLMGPKEVGIFYVRADRIEGLWPALVSQDWGDGVETVMAGARKYECLGQRNDALIAGLVPSLDFHAAIGADIIHSRILELASLMKEGLGRIPGINLVTPATPDMSAGVVVFNFPGRDNRAIYDAIYDQERIAASTKGGIRLCPHIYNTRSEVELAVAAVERAAARLA